MQKNKKMDTIHQQIINILYKKIDKKYHYHYHHHHYCIIYDSNSYI